MLYSTEITPEQLRDKAGQVYEETFISTLYLSPAQRVGTEGRKNRPSSPGHQGALTAIEILLFAYSPNAPSLQLGPAQLNTNH